MGVCKWICQRVGRKCSTDQALWDEASTPEGLRNIFNSIKPDPNNPGVDPVADKGGCQHYDTNEHLGMWSFRQVAISRWHWEARSAWTVEQLAGNYARSDPYSRKGPVRLYVCIV